MQFFLSFKYFFLSLLFFSTLSTSLIRTAFAKHRENTYRHAHTHKHVRRNVSLFLCVSLDTRNSHSTAGASDSNESASTNARLTDFVAMLQLLVLEIDGNDKWRQRDVATTSTQLTRQSHTQQASMKHKEGKLRSRRHRYRRCCCRRSRRVVTNTCIRAHKHACMMNETHMCACMCVCVCVQWGFFSGWFFAVENFTSRHTHKHTVKRLWFSDNFKVEVWSNRCQSHNWVCGYL